MQAPAHWNRIEFLSDVHLHAKEPETARAWTSGLQTSTADAIFILGDLFEVWVGDDDDSEFVSSCLDTLKATARQRAVYFLCGNRDFLIGATFFQRTGIQALDDPTVLDLGACRLLLSHGDALCLEDTEYLAFRTEVRSPAWQQAFLAKPIAERRAMAQYLREQSELRKKAMLASHSSHERQLQYADVDTPLAQQWLQEANAQVLVHGHTHQPAEHALGVRDGQAQQRWVLSDWDARATPPRLERTVWQRKDIDNGRHGLSREPLKP